MPFLVSILKLIIYLLFLSAASIGVYVFFNLGDENNKKLLRSMKLLVFLGALIFFLILVLKMIYPSLR